ncbi:MAG: hypothetical protein HGN29_12625 [Asgard group archaeon]|nr:hypothetical protein [Asgard group archaeon]
MKLRKKLEKGKKSQPKIKRIFLRKLSIELIKRGISNKEIKSTLNEVALSLDEFILETKPNDVGELEQSFGSVEQFCENNMLVLSNEGVLGQVISSIFIILSLLAVPALGLVGFALYPYRWIITGSREQLYGVSFANLGSGFIGTLFGLNMCLWLIYQYYKDRFSHYDFREKIKFIILGLYWFIVCIWLIEALLPYTLFPELIADIWTEGLKYPVIEGAIKWFLTGVFLIVTATIYTRRIFKIKSKEKLKDSKNFWIDDLKVIFIFFILTGFILPNPGMGILILIIGLGMLLFSKINGETWIWGILALLTQVFVIGQNVETYMHGDNPQIVFGIKTIFGFNFEGDFWRSTGIAIGLFVIWTIICIILIRKRKERIFPRFRNPKRSNLVKTCILLIVIIFATLGSQPQYTKIRSVFDSYREPAPMSDILVVDINYSIKTRGTIYLSFYSYINSWDLDRYAQGIDLKGNWTITWTSLDFRTFYMTVIAYEGNFTDEPAELISVNNTRAGIRYKIDLAYFVIEAENPGYIEIHYELDVRTIIYLRPVLDILIVSKVSWFPTWIEIIVVTITVLSLFLTWEKKKLLKPTNNPKEEAK